MINPTVAAATSQALADRNSARRRLKSPRPRSIDNGYGPLRGDISKLITLNQFRFDPLVVAALKHRR